MVVSRQTVGDVCVIWAQSETLGCRDHKNDLLYRSRRLLTKGHERLDKAGETELLGLLDVGTPRPSVLPDTPRKPTCVLYAIDDLDGADAVGRSSGAVRFPARQTILRVPFGGLVW